MSESATIAQTKHPATVSTLAESLAALGVRAGQTILVHTSLRALGWVCGGPVAVLCSL